MCLNHENQIIFSYNILQFSSNSSLISSSSIPCVYIFKPIQYYLLNSLFLLFSQYLILSASLYIIVFFSDTIYLEALQKLNSTLSPYIIDIINISLNDGICQTSFEHAIITPILKKTLLDPNIITNYLPISQLPFLRKSL